MKRLMIRLVTLLCIAPLSGVVIAHPGGHHAYGFISGVLHPLLGVDHLAAILAVGMWTATMPVRAGWKTLAAFCASMLAGAMLAMQGIVLPGIETGIAMSVLIAGLMLVACGRVRVPTIGGGALVALLALFHGQAHGLEIPAAASVTLYATGFALTTATLLLASQTLVRTVHTQWLLRGAGILSGGLGIWLLLGA
jgi:urease accessory protein